MVTSRFPDKFSGLYVVFEEIPEAVASARMAQLAQRLGFDLADPLASHGEVLTNLFERVLAAVLKSEAHFDNLFFARA